jgi:hypothetical protein
MRVKKLSTKPETAADRIIRRTLADTEWLISRETRIQSVLDKERDSLSTAEFNLYSHGSFDFVIFREDEGHPPEFVIEFDGFGHESPRQISRDLIKNWLCVNADLPLLRIGSEDLHAPEKLSVLEWLVDTFAQVARDSEDDVDEDPALGSDPPSVDAKYITVNVQTGEVFRHSKPPAWVDPLELWDPDDYALGANGGYFDSEHPFPANASIAQRLLRQFGISVGKAIECLESSWETAPYQLSVDWPGKQPPVIEDHSVSEYVVSERAFRVGVRGGHEPPIYEGIGRGRFASALKLPVRPGRAPSKGTGPSQPEPRRFPTDLPWLDPWGVARELALYDALSKVEDWAEGKLRDLTLQPN